MPSMNRSRVAAAVANLALFTWALGFSLFTGMTRLESTGPPSPDWLVLADLLGGVAGLVMIWWRRRAPTGIAVALVLMSAVSELAAGPMLVALFTVAVHRRRRTAWTVFGLSIVTAAVMSLLRPTGGDPWLLVLVFGVAVQAAAVGWGLYIQYRRRLLWSLQDRAARAETETRLRMEHAQRLVRDAIAREIHDVLGHRLSILSLHAGALEYRQDASPDEVRRAVRVIRESSHQALQDLREVIGVLRAPITELGGPTLADLPELVEEAADAGSVVRLDRHHAEPVPDALGRAGYRIVQEGLTNARRHAPGAEVDIDVAGEPGGELTVSVRNTAPPTAVDPGTPGRGLVGLTERVALLEGRLEYGPTDDGGWHLDARIPWPS
ncbi:signal transduction histidine kinase [Stackebrandtia albiflava]|uniref:histidine kinase n=1 Tax=Stackebrandtia albiflava TaxID=406432 RepID=A0A562V2T7_9ACTN|nr:histidine kinase [Stackebrandtia albiflava]TWJ12132.1 signal transduction histidine kinase [Stackebrandtia albiflava]